MISREKMIALYTAMVKFRKIAVESGRAAERAVDETSGTPGWEATLAGVTSDLVDGDRLSAAPANAIRRVVDTLRRDAKDDPALPSNNADDKGFEVACQGARLLKTRGGGKVAVHLSGGPAAGEEWRVRLAEVARHSLPLLIVSYGRAADAVARPDAPIASGNRLKPAARIAGVPLITVDGSDVCAVYRVASESIFRARHGRGPTLISCVTIPDTGKLGLLPEREAARSLDPILSMESYLTRRRILTKAVKGRIDSVLCAEMDPVSGMRLQ